MDCVTAGFLAEECKVPIRTIQFWTDQGVLKPEAETMHQGRGQKRLYGAHAPWLGERKYALIAAELTRMNLNVGAIRRVIDMFRQTVPDGQFEEPPIGWHKALSASPIGAALLGLQSLVIVLSDASGWLKVRVDLPALTPHVVGTLSINDQKALGVEASEEHRIYMPFAATIPGEFVAEHSSGYLLNLAKVLAPLKGATRLPERPWAAPLPLGGGEG